MFSERKFLHVAENIKFGNSKLTSQTTRIKLKFSVSKSSRQISRLVKWICIQSEPLLGADFADCGSKCRLRKKYWWCHPHNPSRYVAGDKILYEKQKSYLKISLSQNNNNCSAGCAHKPYRQKMYNVWNKTRKLSALIRAGNKLGRK